MVPSADAGEPGHIGAETVRGAETRPLADQHDHRPGAQAFADLVTERDPGQACKDERREVRLGHERLQRVNDRRRMPMRGDCRKPIGDDECHIVIAPFKLGQASPGETAAEVRVPEIGIAIGSCAGEADCRLSESSGQQFGIEFGVNRVGRPCVGQLEVEHGFRRQRLSRSAEPDPRLAQGAQPRR
jgi:hypothetical protein